MASPQIMPLEPTEDGVATLLLRPRPAGCFWPLRGVVLPSWERDLWPCLDEAEPAPEVYLAEAEVIVPQWQALGAAEVAPGILGVGALGTFREQVDYHVRDVPCYCNGGLLLAVPSDAPVLARLGAVLGRFDLVGRLRAGIGDPDADHWPWPDAEVRSWLEQQVVRGGLAIVSAVDGCGVVIVADLTAAANIDQARQAG